MRRTHVAATVAAVGLLAAACAGRPAPATEVATPGVSAAAATTASGGAGPSPSSGGPTPTPVASLGPGERTVSVVAIDGYAEWGGVDPKVKWVGTFEKETGCKVSLRYYDPRQEEKPGDFPPSSFDVISATPEVGGRLMNEGKAAPLNTALLHGYDKIPKRLRTLPSVTRGERVYGVPYVWATNEILYDAGKVSPDGPQSLFTDKGPVMLRDRPLSLADAALALEAEGADAGADIKDPFDLTDAQLDAAAELFTSGKDGRRTFWRDPVEVVQGFATGSVRLAQATPYHLDVLRQGHKPVRALTDRPVTGWADAWMVSAQAAHPSCAYKWLDFTMSADVQRKVSAWMGLAPANPEGCTGAARRICADYRVGTSRAFRGVYFAVRPEAYDKWVERWSRIVS
ncbi:extracellular solute-binding protein [Microbispora siamensis]|uniref:Spermidine/putrescine ABC transporter substrate-binding protein n=1 Tax=Microbispora siamensis TaxID=564413 RepID=A0ABQ4GZ23_9ACTN|nr:extracellular solute-binding protein [Microbispora siamensis]GIH66678.1 spermidine/putrescine ABC transporter substrate-binding protein [Microbispora siamensis]